MMVKKAMPEKGGVQRRLEDVVGLMKMDWPLFSEHIVYHVELYRKDKKKKDEEDKQLANKLTQLQLGELSKLVKKEKEKSKTQAPMVAATQPSSPKHLCSHPPLTPTQREKKPLPTPHITIIIITSRYQEVVAISEPPEGGAVGGLEEMHRLQPSGEDGKEAETTYQGTTMSSRTHPTSHQAHHT
ncbi:hypothetical protein ABVT39_016920 [Epinephelus coioides]